MPVMFEAGALLFVTDGLAMDVACCCEAPPCTCDPLPSTLNFTVANVAGTAECCTLLNAMFPLAWNVGAGGWRYQVTDFCDCNFTPYTLDILATLTIVEGQCVLRITIDVFAAGLNMIIIFEKINAPMPCCDWAGMDIPLVSFTPESECACTDGGITGSVTAVCP